MLAGPINLERLTSTEQVEFWLAMGGLLCLTKWRSIRDKWTARSASSWPTLTSEIFSILPGSSSDDYSLTVSYGYHQQEYQSGRRTVSFRNKAEMESFQERVKCRKKLVIRYDPQDPSQSSVLLSDNE
jgi:Protein of unknown function (DUF3592)